MLDGICPYFCFSKHPGGGLPVSGMDDLDVKGTDAVWNFGDRIYRRLVVGSTETKERGIRAKQKKKIES